MLLYIDADGQVYGGWPWPFRPTHRVRQHWNNYLIVDVQLMPGEYLIHLAPLEVEKLNRDCTIGCVIGIPLIAIATALYAVGMSGWQLACMLAAAPLFWGLRRSWVQTRAHWVPFSHAIRRWGRQPLSIHLAGVLSSFPFGMLALIESAPLLFKAFTLGMVFVIGGPALWNLLNGIKGHGVDGPTIFPPTDRPKSPHS